jgi:GxxExxY protein
VIRLTAYPLLNELTGLVIGAAIEVHGVLGPGLLESAYSACLCKELELLGIPHEKEKPLPVEYKGEKLDCGYRLDFLVDNRLIAELKTIESIQPIHEAQLLTYLKPAQIKTGLIINFKRGERGRTYTFHTSLRSSVFACLLCQEWVRGQVLKYHFLSQRE